MGITHGQRYPFRFGLSYIYTVYPLSLRMHSIPSAHDLHVAVFGSLEGGKQSKGVRLVLVVVVLVLVV